MRLEPQRATENDLSFRALSLVLEVFSSISVISERLANASEKLSRSLGFQFNAGTDPAVQWVAAFLMDLPASERNHHRDRFGLLDHSLEVAARAAMTLRFYPGHTGGRSPQELSYIGFHLGIIHDLGKVFDMTVRPPGSGEAWSPFNEPLAGFYGRRGIRPDGGAVLKWISPRPSSKNPYCTITLAPRVLPKAIWNLHGRLLFQCLGDWFVGRSRRDDVDPLVHRLVQTVKQSDVASATGDDQS